ncbi:helix-turn-helix transcriptional regulator [Pseudonocardia nematodicida]|uniref:Helix-turn-helix transcriptional regulator n=1 Tax=Pseudonocardia nematodicida TaxID=1206997 RepID=A0ABV1KEG2_9PSEU
MPERGARAPSRSLADKLNYLVSVAHPQERASYTLDELVAGIRESGGSVSRATLNSIRLGRNTNPSKATLEDIARFFEVPVSYLHDDPHPEISDEDRELLVLVRETGMVELVRSIGRLRPATRQALEKIVDDLWSMQAGGQQNPSDRS